MKLSMRAFTLSDEVQIRLEEFLLNFEPNHLDRFLPVQLRKRGPKSSAPELSFQPYIPPPAPPAPPVLDSHDLLPADYPGLYEQFFPATPVDARPAAWSGITRIFNNFDSNDAYSFKRKDFNHEVKRLAQKNVLAVRRAERDQYNYPRTVAREQARYQRTVHRGAERSTTGAVTAVNASILVEALLTLAMDELKERIASCDDKKPVAINKGTPSRNVTKSGHKPVNAKARRRA